MLRFLKGKQSKEWVRGNGAAESAYLCAAFFPCFFDVDKWDGQGQSACHVYHGGKEDNQTDRGGHVA